MCTIITKARGASFYGSKTQTEPSKALLYTGDISLEKSERHGRRAQLHKTFYMSASWTSHAEKDKNMHRIESLHTEKKEGAKKKKSQRQ